MLYRIDSEHLLTAGIAKCWPRGPRVGLINSKADVWNAVMRLKPVESQLLLCC